MKEYIEREAAIDHLIGVTVIKYAPAFSLGMGAAAAEIQMLPAADVVDVVRCKDCKYYAAMVTDTVSGDMETAPWGICTQPWFNSDEYDVQENEYCSYGEREMDEEE